MKKVLAGLMVGVVGMVLATSLMAVDKPTKNQNVEITEGTLNGAVADTVTDDFVVFTTTDKKGNTRRVTLQADGVAELLVALAEVEDRDSERITETLLMILKAYLCNQASERCRDDDDPNNFEFCELWFQHCDGI